MPSSIAGYEVSRSLGTGVMGSVYLASGDGSVFHAVKVLNRPVTERLSSAQLFVNEIVSDNILQWRSIEDSEDGEIFISDYLEVKPAVRRSFRATLSDEILELYAVCADTLATVHARDILHGNVKTSNILVRRAGPGKVMPILSDFGIAYRYDPAEWAEDMVRAAFAYMAPEKIHDVTHPDKPSGRTGPPADIYSLTVSLIESLTGQELYREGATPEQIVAVKEQKKFRLLNINHPFKHVEIGPLNELTAQNLSVDPDSRTQTMKELAERLRACKAKKSE